MKIMILVPSFGRGSPIEGAFLFAKYLHEKGIDVLFVSLDENYNSKKNMIDEIEKVKLKYECLQIRGWIGLLRYRSRFHNFVTENHITAVMAYLFRPTLLASSLSNVLKIASVRGILKNNYALKLGRVFSKIPLFIEMKALQRMDHVFSMTKKMTEWLVAERINPEKISIINNFIDVRSVISSVENETFHYDNSINIGVFCIFYRIKRIDIALKAIAEVIHKYKQQLTLHLVGDGPERTYLEKLSIDLNIKNHVIFHGFLTNPLPVMNNMDLVLLTSESEGVPRCLIEAISLGKTVVASDIPGINDLIHDKHTGYLFSCGNIEKLSSLIENIVTNNLFIQPDLPVDFALENHDVNSCCEKMLKKIYEIYNIFRLKNPDYAA